MDRLKINFQKFSLLEMFPHPPLKIKCNLFVRRGVSGQNITCTWLSPGSELKQESVSFLLHMKVLLVIWVHIYPSERYWLYRFLLLLLQILPLQHSQPPILTSVKG